MDINDWTPSPPPPRKRRAKAPQSFKDAQRSKLKSAAARKRNNAFDAQGRGGFGSFSFPKSGGANASEKRNPNTRPFIGLRDMYPKRRGR